METKQSRLSMDRDPVPGVDFTIENFGSYIVAQSSEGNGLRLDGSLEIKRVDGEQWNYLISLEKEGLHAAYLPGIDIFRIGEGVLRDFEKDPLIVDRVFVHEAAHRRFFQLDRKAQIDLVDSMRVHNPDLFQSLALSFYNSRLGKSYAGVHAHDFKIGDFLMKGKKSGLRDHRNFQVEGKGEMRLGLFVTEMFSYMSPLFLDNGKKEFEKEAAEYKDPVLDGSFFHELYTMYESIMSLPENQRQQCINIFQDATPRKVESFRQLIAASQKKRKR